MAEGPEKRFENRIKKELVRRGAYVVKQHGNAFTKVGVPDLLTCYKGHFLAIEVKAENGRVAPLQEHHVGEIEKAGGTARIFRPSQWEEFLNLLDTLDETL